jgi:hypothetical protein
MSAPAQVKKKKPLLKKYLEQYNIAPIGIGIAHVGIALIALVLLARGVLIPAATILFFTMPLWLFVVTPKTVRFYWLHYVQHQFTSGPMAKGVLLEIKLPREISKSPRAMELVFESLYFRPQMATKFLTHWRGHVRLWYSLEIVSNKDGLRFYIWCWERFRPQVEAAFYSQYPTIQVVDAPVDYAAAYVAYKGEAKKINCWGMAYKLSRPDVYPIRTYYDYELEKDPKVEHRNDPFVTLLEQLQSHEPYEQFWLQIMFQPEWTNNWKDDIKTEIQKVYDNTKKPFTDSAGNKQKGYAQLKPMQFEIVRAMERATMKIGFAVSIRALYISEEAYNTQNSQTISRIFVPMGSDSKDYFNMIGLDTEKHTSGFDYPWEYWFGRRPKRVEALFNAWVARSAFAPPHIEDSFVLTTEELATIFHIPGADARALGIKRIESSTKGAPPNLPI